MQKPVPNEKHYLVQPEGAAQFELERKAAIEAYVNNSRDYLKQQHLERGKALGLGQAELAKIDREWRDAIVRRLDAIRGRPEPNANTKANASEIIRRRFGIEPVEEPAPKGNVRMVDKLDAVLARIEQQVIPDAEPEDGPEGETSLQLLQTVYRDRKQPLNVRVRCAVEALAHEYPRVSAVAVTSMSGQSFAEALDRCIARSQGPVLLNGPSPPELPASDLKKPFSNYRNNYRRY